MAQHKKTKGDRAQEMGHSVPWGLKFIGRAEILRTRGSDERLQIGWGSVCVCVCVCACACACADSKERNCKFKRPLQVWHGELIGRRNVQLQEAREKHPGEVGPRAVEREPRAPGEGVGTQQQVAGSSVAEGLLLEKVRHSGSAAGWGA